jgi:AraC-like DNA-binding protein/mannose-6-phosphate isomerase-like protein (cupin superfamily)
VERFAEITTVPPDQQRVIKAENTPALDAASHVILPSFSGYHYTVVDRIANFPEHVHYNHEVLYVEEGVYRCRLNDVEIEVPQGGVVVVKPLDRHADWFAPPLRCVAVTFALRHPATPERGLSLFADPIRPEQQVALMDRASIVPLIARMLSETQINDDVSPMVGDALLREFFWRMVRAFGPDTIAPAFTRSSAEQGWRLKLRQLFRAHRDKASAVADLAADLGVSERTLTQRCQEILGESPSHALMNYKLAEAHAMVTQTEMTVQQISYNLGFANPYHFSTAFKRRFGVSPAHLREKA